jgi:superfamily II DNA/RNA helicase
MLNAMTYRGGRLKLPDLQSLVLDEFDALLEYKPHRDPTAAIVTNLKQRHRDALQAMLGSPKLDNYLRPGFAQAMADRDDVLVTSPTKGESGKAGKAITRVSRTVIHGVVHVEQRRLALETLRRILHTDPLPQQILIFVENARKVGIVVDKVCIAITSTPQLAVRCDTM